MELRKHYINAVIYPSVLVVVATVIFSVIDNYDYESEWLTAESAIMVSLIVSLLFSMLICTLSLTIFLNKLERIGKNIILSLLAWLFLPFLCIGFILINEIKFNIDHNVGFGSDFIYILIMTIPFGISLTRTFIRYRLKYNAR